MIELDWTMRVASYHDQHHTQNPDLLIAFLIRFGMFSSKLNALNWNIGCPFRAKMRKSVSKRFKMVYAPGFIKLMNSHAHI